MRGEEGGRVEGRRVSVGGSLLVLLGVFANSSGLPHKTTRHEDDDTSAFEKCPSVVCRGDVT